MSKEIWLAPLEKRAFQWLVGLRGSLFLLTLLLPPFFFGGTVRSSGFLIQILILSGFFCYLVQGTFFETEEVYWNRVRKPLFYFSIFLLYIVIQWLGKDIVFSKKWPGTIAVFKTRDYLIQLLCYVFFFISLQDLLNTRRKINFVTLLIGAQTVFLIALGYYQQSSHTEKFSKLYGVFDMSQYGTFFSSFTNPNHYGGYLMLATLFFMAYVAYYLTTIEIFRVDTEFSQTLFFGLLTVLSSFSILRAEARAALFVQIWAVLIFSWMSFYIKKGVSWILILATTAALLSGVVFLNLTQFDFSHLWPKVLLKDFVERAGIYRDALGILKDFPIFGTGLGTGMYAISHYQVTGVEEYAWIHFYSHHLELLADTGVVGFFLFTMPVAWLALSSLRSCLKHPSRWRRIYGAASFTALAAVAFLSVMDDYLITPALAILFIVHLVILTLCGNKNILSLDQSDKASVFSPTAPRILTHKRHLRVAVPVVGLIAFIFFVTWKDHAALNLINNAQDNISRLKRAASLRPDDPKVWIRIGEYYFDKSATSEGETATKLAKKSIEAYDRAVSLTPMYGYYWMLAGRARVLSRDRMGGLRTIAKSAELVPYNRDYYLYLIVNALMLADETPWPEEKKPMEDLALLWVKKTLRLKRPLTETDYGYIRNYGEDCYGTISPNVKSRLLDLIRQVPVNANSKNL